LTSLVLPCLFFNPPPTPLLSTLPLHDALPISHALHSTRRLRSRQCLPCPIPRPACRMLGRASARHSESPEGVLCAAQVLPPDFRSEEHTSELQSLTNLVCRLLLEKKKLTHTDT